MRYSSRERRWYGKPPNTLPAFEGYDPSSPGYAERNRENVTEHPGGLIRIDLGEPVTAKNT